MKRGVNVTAKMNEIMNAPVMAFSQHLFIYITQNDARRSFSQSKNVNNRSNHTLILTVHTNQARPHSTIRREANEHPEGSMPLQGLRLLHVELIGALLVVQIAHVCLRLLELLLLVVLHLITMVRRLGIQSTFRFDSIYCALVAHHTLTLLLVN